MNVSQDHSEELDGAGSTPGSGDGNVSPFRRPGEMADEWFPGEPDSSREARFDAILNVNYLIRNGGTGDSPATLVDWMERNGLKAPGVSTISDWVAGNVATQRGSQTAYRLDMAGELLDGYPPSGRDLRDLVSEVKAAPDGSASGADEGNKSDEPALDELGITVQITGASPGTHRAEATVTEVDESTDPDGRRTLKITTLVVLIVLLIVAVSATLLIRGSDRASDVDPVAPTNGTDTQTATKDASPTETPTSGPTDDPTGAASGIPVSESLNLGNGNFCRWRLGRRPIPLVSTNPLTMRVDARCNFPAQRDPEVDKGAATFTSPTNDDPNQSAGYIKDGETFVPDCWTRSQDTVTDARQNASNIWIHVPDGNRFIPNVNIGGGYTERQLVALGLNACG